MIPIKESYVSRSISEKSFDAETVIHKSKVVAAAENLKKKKLKLMRQDSIEETLQIGPVPQNPTKNPVAK